MDTIMMLYRQSLKRKHTNASCILPQIGWQPMGTKRLAIERVNDAMLFGLEMSATQQQPNCYEILQNKASMHKLQKLFGATAYKKHVWHSTAAKALRNICGSALLCNNRTRTHHVPHLLRLRLNARGGLRATYHYKASAGWHTSCKRVLPKLAIQLPDAQSKRKFIQEAVSCFHEVLQLNLQHQQQICKGSMSSGHGSYHLASTCSVPSCECMPSSCALSDNRCPKKAPRTWALAQEVRGMLPAPLSKNPHNSSN